MSLASDGIHPGDLDDGCPGDQCQRFVTFDFGFSPVLGVRGSSATHCICLVELAKIELPYHDKIRKRLLRATRCSD